MVVGLALVVALLGLVPSAAGQPAAPDRPTQGRFRLGVLRFTPSLVVSDLGVDTNVFNESVDPKRDTTAGLGPAIAWWMNAGRTRISASNAGQYLYFKEYANQRGWNTVNTLRLDVLAGRLTPFVSGSYINTRNRPGYEIDSRARAKTTVAGAGADLRVSGKTRITASGQASTIAFDERETFLGASLARLLNEQVQTGSLALRYNLTPLTTFVVKADGIRDRFEFETSRNADSVRLMPGFEFKPFALISGQALVGYRRFRAQQAALPDFEGAIAAVQVAYIRRATKIEGMVNRDLVFSAEPTLPYYALTDAALTVTQKVTRTWDVRLRTGRQVLAYRSFTVARSAETTPATDRGKQYGAGVGYQLGDTARIGVDATYSTRGSNTDIRRFEGFRAGASVSYGLQP